MMHYFDQAATSLQKPKAVAEAVYNALGLHMFGNPSRGGHDASIHADKLVYRIRGLVKALLGAQDYHVVFTKNATESLNIAIKGLLQAGDHVITSRTEHNSVLRPLYEVGVELDFVECDGNGAILRYEQLVDLRKKETKAVVISHASNVTGNVHDLERISQFCQAHDLLLIVDAAQTVGAIPIDLGQTPVDVFCFTGHKSLYGPMGTGGMCIGKNVKIRPLLSGGSGLHTFSKEQPENYPERLEAGTVNVHGLAGLEAGLNYLFYEGVEELHQKSMALTMYFYEQLQTLDGITIYGDFNHKRTAVVACNLGNWDSQEVSNILNEEYKIAVRAGTHCAPLMHEHFGTKEQGIVRFSFSPFNTKTEMDIAIHALKDILEESEG